MSRRSRVRASPGVHQPQWRNRIARRTSNPEVVGSSPTWGLTGGKIPSHKLWSYSVVVITLGFDSSDMGSIPIET